MVDTAALPTGAAPLGRRLIGRYAEAETMQRRLLSLLQSAQVLSTAFASQRSDRHVTSTVLFGQGGAHPAVRAAEEQLRVCLAKQGRVLHPAG